MDEEDFLVAEMEKLGLPSAFGSRQAGQKAMHTTRSSRKTTIVKEVTPGFQAQSTCPDTTPSRVSGKSGNTFSLGSAHVGGEAVSNETCPWQATWDPHYKCVYYYHTLTSTTQWTIPEGFIPSPIQYLDDNGEISMALRSQAEALSPESTQVGEVGSPLGDARENFLNQTEIYFQKSVGVTEVVMYNHVEREAVSGGSTHTVVSEATGSTNSTDYLTMVDAEFQTISKAKKKKIKILKKKKKLLLSSAEALQVQAALQVRTAEQETMPYSEADWAVIAKYYIRRYSLFSLFDLGIQLDREGWYSVTPEEIAAHQARRCAADVIVDAFTGCGGNAIQFAQTCRYVIAIDIDPAKIELARHNATVYGVEARIEFVAGDFMRLAPKLKADVVFLSPPWGGPGYIDAEEYDLDTMLLPCRGAQLFKAALSVAPNVALFVPRNTKQEQLEELTWVANPPLEHDVEVNIISDKGRVKGLTAYYGSISAPEN